MFGRLTLYYYTFRVKEFRLTLTHCVFSHQKSTVVLSFSVARYPNSETITHTETLTISDCVVIRKDAYGCAQFYLLKVIVVWAPPTKMVCMAESYFPIKIKLARKKNACCRMLNLKSEPKPTVTMILGEVLCCEISGFFSFRKCPLYCNNIHTIAAVPNLNVPIFSNYKKVEEKKSVSAHSVLTKTGRSLDQFDSVREKVVPPKC